jgi:Fe-Mn family superoxide dismutase
MTPSRRQFFTTTGILSAAIGAAGASPSGGGTPGQHQQPELGYAFDALEPVIDAKTLETHYTKHHAGYVKGLNKAETALADARATGEFDKIQYWQRQFAFHGGGHFLHSLYWSIMAAPGTTANMPEGELAQAIEKDFGSFEAFKGQFAAAAKAVEGSGWCALLCSPLDGGLCVSQVENHQKLTPWNGVPILTVDMWEHAYYLKYQNQKADYVDAWWDLVNWPAVAEHREALKT